MLTGVPPSFKTAYMESSNNECSFSHLPQSSLDSSLNYHCLDPACGVPPTPIKHGFSGIKSTDDLTGNSDAFVENLHSKLLTLPMEGESRGTSQTRQGHRRSYRFSPYSRSRSLCSTNVESRSLVRQHASQNGIQKPLSVGKRIYARRMALTREIDPSTENLDRSIDRESYAINKKVTVRSASLRKAESLRKISETRFDNAEELIPTTPSTPVKSSTPDRIIPSPIPIISPPPFIGPRVHLSAETTAKIRLGKYKEREGRTTDYDYARSLQRVDEPWSGSSEEWELLLGLGRRTRGRQIGWLLQFMPKNDSHSVSSSFSSTSSTVSSSSFSTFDQSMEGLIDQLKTSPETRFHAAWMFLRYHYVMGVVRTKGVTQEELPLYPSHGIWNVTLASLAISVKLHRDFLHPLLPVEAVDYMQISPHDMGYEDFEYAQRTILNAFDYKLGVTPQPFMDQVWIALPSLRELFSFDEGWNQVKKETWWLLFNSLYEPDVLRFSVSILTAAALSRAVVSVLTWRYHYKSDWNLTLNFSRAIEGGKWNFVTPQQFQDRARDDSDGMIADIKAVLGVGDIQMEECRNWFEERCGPN